MRNNLPSRIPRHFVGVRSTTSTNATRTTALSKIPRERQTLKREDYPVKALEIYSSVTNPFIFPISCLKSQQLAAQRLADAGRFDDIETLIESLKTDPRSTEESHFCNLIRCYGKAGMFDHAIKLYHQMEELGITRSCYSFNALLAAGNDAHVFDRVRQVFDEMPEKYAFEPDAFSYASLIQSYCAKGEPEKGLKIMKEMKGKGVMVSSVEFTTVLDGFYKKGKVAEAEKVWDEMVKKVDVGLTSWNVKISHAVEPEAVLRLFDQMKLARLDPSSTSYSYLVASYCKNDRLHEAMKVFFYLEQRRFSLKAATYSTLINHLCKEQEYAKAYYVFMRSALQGKVLNIKTVKILVEGLMKKNLEIDAKGLIAIIKKEYPPHFINDWNKFEGVLGLAG